MARDLHHLVASIPSPPSNGFHLGPLFVRAYGLMYVVGISLAILIARRRWEARGGSRQVVYDVALWGVPAGILGGRLYFDVTTPSFVPAHWWGPFAVWDGGLGIWGGIALATVVGVWRLRRHRVPVAQFMDAAVPGILVAQAIGRIGNYFNQELFGGPTSLPWALHIDLAHRPDGYAQFATFHPTFLYELIFDLAFAGALVLLGRRGKVRAPGLFALYVAGYSGFRIFEESLRVDPSQHFLGLRLNFYVASVLCLAGLIWFSEIQRPWLRRRGTAKGAAAIALVTASALAGCGQGGKSHPAATNTELDLTAQRVAFDVRVESGLRRVVAAVDIDAPAAPIQVDRDG
jgi:prolipoprotein diacylglyceryl transferase